MKAQITVKSLPTFEPKDKPYEITCTDCKGLVLRVQPSGVATFYAVLRVNGRNVRYRIGNAGLFKLNDNGRWTLKAGIHPDTARGILTKRKGEAADGQDPQAERKRKRAEAKAAKFQTVGGFYKNQYASFLQTERKSGKLIERRIKSCFEWLFDKPMSEVTPFLLQSWRKQQLESGKSAITVNRDAADLKAMLSKAVEWGFLATHPLSRLKPAKAEDNSRVRFLTPDEENRLLNALDQREADARAARERFNEWRKKRHLDLLPLIPDGHYTDHLKPLVLLALNTGLRRGELFSLEWRDIDFLHNRLTVRAAAAKGAKPRHVPLNTSARDLLKQWKKQQKNDDEGKVLTGLVFPGDEGKRLDNIASSWRNLTTKANLADFTFHDLRHTFATRALQGGADIVTLSKLLGHSSLKMTLRYSHVTDEALVAAVEGLSTNG